MGVSGATWSDKLLGRGMFAPASSGSSTSETSLWETSDMPSPASSGGGSVTGGSNREKIGPQSFSLSATKKKTPTPKSTSDDWRQNAMASSPTTSAAQTKSSFDWPGLINTAITSGTQAVTTIAQAKAASKSGSKGKKEKTTKTKPEKAPLVNYEDQMGRLRQGASRAGKDINTFVHDNATVLIACGLGLLVLFILMNRSQRNTQPLIIRE